MTSSSSSNIMEQANVAEEKLNKSLDAIYNEVYKGYILGIQRENYLCAADCCRKHDQQKDVAKCADVCSERLKKIYNKIETDSDSMNQELGRAIMSCQEKERRKFKKEYSSLEPSERQQFDEGLMRCVTACFEEHRKELPKLKDRLIYFIKKN